MKKTIKSNLKAEKIKETIDTILEMENAPKHEVKKGVDLNRIASKLTQRRAEEMKDEE